MVGAALGEPADTDATPGPDRGAASRRRPAGGAARAPRRDRRDTLRSLAAELSVAAARVDDIDVDDLPDIRLPKAPALTLHGVSVEVAAEPDEDEADFGDLRLAAMGPAAASETVETPVVEITASAAAPASVAVAGGSAEDVITGARLEMARAEAGVLAAKMDAEAAARAEAERRLADAEDELKFLRAEIQMVNQNRRKPAGRLRRLVAALTGRRRKVVPSNLPKGR
jgi:hypothetical protein